MVDAEAERLTDADVRGREGQREVARGGDAPFVAVVEHGRTGHAADRIRLLLSLGERLDDDAELVSLRDVIGFEIAHHAVLAVDVEEDLAR